MGRKPIPVPSGIYRIYSRKKALSYRVRIRIKGHPPLSKNFKSLVHAKKWKRMTEGAIERGGFLVEKDRHTFSEASEKYLEEVVSARSKNQDAIRRHLKRWKKELGPLHLSKIAPSHIASVRDQLLKEKTARKKRRSPATVIRYLATLSHLFSIAVKEWEWATDNPVFKVRKPKEPAGRVRYLSKEEIASLLSCCKKSENPHLFAIVLIALQTGMRKGEILSLKWEDIDFSNKWAYLRDTKNGSPRIVPLSDTLIALLGKTRRQNAPYLLLFPSTHDHCKP